MLHRFVLLFFLFPLFVACNEQTDQPSQVIATDTVAYVSSKKENPIKGEPLLNEKQKTKISKTHSCPLSFPIVEDTISPKELAEWYNQLAKAPQLFRLSTRKDTSILCAEGTHISIKAQSFVSAKTGKAIKGQVTLWVKEYYKLSDMLLANLSTATTGQLLETGGMLYIQATSNGEPCVLVRGKELLMEMPRKYEKEDMQCFAGQWKNDHEIVWTLEEGSSDLSKIYDVVDQQANLPSQYNGGFFNSYFLHHVIYPREVEKLGIEGRVIVRCMIDWQGTIREAQVIQGIHPACDKAALDAIKKLPTLNPAKKRGVPVNSMYSFTINFWIPNRDSSTLDSAYKSKFEQKYSSGDLQKTNIADLNAYVFSSSSLGWINCDRFVRDDPGASKITYTIPFEEVGQTVVNIVFHRYKSILNGYSEKTSINFDGIPLGEEITIVAFRYKNGKPFFAIQDATVSALKRSELIFQPVTLEALRSEMKKLEQFD